MAIVPKTSIFPKMFSNVFRAKTMLGNFRLLLIYVFAIIMVFEVGVACWEDQSPFPFFHKMLATDNSIEVAVGDALIQPNITGWDKLMVLGKIYTSLMVYYIWFIVIKFLVFFGANTSENRLWKFILSLFVMWLILSFSLTIMSPRETMTLPFTDQEVTMPKIYAFSGLWLFVKNVGFFITAFKPLQEFIPNINETISQLNQSTTIST